MIVRGRVQNGVIVLDQGIRLAEGQQVTVLASDIPMCTAPLQGSAPHGLLDVPPVSLGPILRAVTSDDDILDEMLEERL